MKCKDLICEGIRLDLFDGAAAGGESGGGMPSALAGADTGGTKTASPAAAGRGEEQRRSAARGLTTERSGRIDGPGGRQTAREVGGVRYPSGQPDAELDRPKKTGEKTVLYGKQPEQAAGGQTEPPAAGEEARKGVAPETAAMPKEDHPEGVREAPLGGDTREAKRKAFLELVSSGGEYKAQFDEQVQRIISRRFQETKDLERQVSGAKPILDLLAQRYGITDADSAKLLAAVEKDNALFAEAAEKAGMTPEQWMEFERMKRENQALREADRRSKADAFAQSKVQGWFRQGEELKTDYPDFDLAQEAADPRFLSLLKAGIPVRHAYEVIHMDRIKAAVARRQARTTEKQVVDGIRAKGARPAEVGMASASGFIIKDDASKLTRQDRAEIARRATMGEKIRF